MTTYVYFIGGTGARVLKSLTMLLASGVSIGAGNSIVPIIIDYDAKNGDLKRSREMLDTYIKLHDAARYGDEELGFFRTPIELKEKFSIVNVQLDSERNTFEKYIDYSSLDDTTRMLIRTLYDNSLGSDTELNLDLSVGFKGNPNIGSVVFNDYFRQKEYGYDEFATSVNAKDRVFIVGSIFGGTGASGLPQLVKKFSSSTHTNLKEARLGACVVLPYFDVAPRDDSAINSMSFNSKTKAALTYYKQEINELMDEIYYIGCSYRGGRYDNVEGGDKQKNDAHMVEMLAAMSIVEFAGRVPEADEGKRTQCYEYQATMGIGEFEGKASLKEVSYLDLFGTTMNNSIEEKGVYVDYIRHLNAFAYFTKYCSSYTYNDEDSGRLRGQGYYKTLGKGINESSTFGQTLISFQNDFKEWIKQMAGNDILKFDPYQFDGDKNMKTLLNIENTNTNVNANVVATIRNMLSSAIKERVDRALLVEGQEGCDFLKIGSKAGLAAADIINAK